MTEPHADGDLAITHHVQGQGGRYIAEVPGESETGYLEWQPGDDEDVRIARTTVVPRAIGGRGVAAELTRRMVEDARREGFRIRPDCSYVARKFEENPDWSDLRA